MTMTNHGGKRTGAGRKKGTIKVIKVSISRLFELLPKEIVEALIEESKVKNGKASNKSDRGR